jgi:hypothetical protein
LDQLWWQSAFRRRQQGRALITFDYALRKQISVMVSMEKPTGAVSSAIGEDGRRRVAIVFSNEPVLHRDDDR